jgi:RNA polymerase sigma factor (sigma-70 family)
VQQYEGGDRRQYEQRIQIAEDLAVHATLALPLRSPDAHCTIEAIPWSAGLVSAQPQTADRIGPDLVTRLYERAGASRWSLAEPAFRAALDRSAAKALPAEVRGSRALERYLESLHLEDLALACACEAGIESAWDHFVLEYRHVLYRAADALEPGGGAREIADGIYADLFGLQERDGDRRSLFRYFHGRSRLATWLRAVLAQRHVDRIRSDRRLAPIAADDEGSPALVSPAAPDPDRPRYLALVKVALLRAVACLPDRDRLRLGCYYRQDLTLAQTSRILGEHEATVSRQLARSRKQIRSEVERYLRAEQGFNDAEIARCFESTMDDPGPLDLGQILGGGSIRKESEPERSR